MAKKLVLDLDRVMRKAIAYIPMTSEQPGAVEELTAYLHSKTDAIVAEMNIEWIIESLEKRLAIDLAEELAVIIEKEQQNVLDELNKENKEEPKPTK